MEGLGEPGVRAVPRVVSGFGVCSALRDKTCSHHAATDWSTTRVCPNHRPADAEFQVSGILCSAQWTGGETG